MEKLLLRLARQLDAIDEASLIDLWSKYATIVSRFEPTKRWEEAAIVFSLIQAKHWKNQLFNYNVAQLSKPASMDGEQADPFLDFGFSLEPFDGDAAQENKETSCRVHQFRRRDD